MKDAQTSSDPPSQGVAFHEHNLRTAILTLLLQEGDMPRVLLSEALVTTPAMVSRCIKRMKADGLVCDEGKSKGPGGRTCRNVALNPDAGVTIGIEYDDREIATVAIDFAGRMEQHRSFPVPKAARDGSPREMLPALFAAIRTTCEDSLRSRRLLGIAAVDPGIVDTREGVTISSIALPEWKQVPLQQKLSAEFNVPACLSSTSNAILAAVDRQELKRRYADVLYLEYRRGIGCAIKSNGQQAPGSRGMAGELTVPGPRAFTPDTRGRPPIFMEQTLGFAGIRQRLQDIEHPAIRDAMAEDSLELIILGLATQGDKQVCKVLSETWYKLGLVYGSLANLLDPGAIVLDPHFGQADADSCAALRRGIMEHLVGPHADQIEIIVSQLGAEAAPLGAALALLDDLILNGTVTRIISQRGTGSP